jgi:hypothetical protein
VLSTAVADPVAFATLVLSFVTPEFFELSTFPPDPHATMHASATA